VLDQRGRHGPAVDQLRFDAGRPEVTPGRQPEPLPGHLDRRPEQRWRPLRRGQSRSALEHAHLHVLGVLRRVDGQRQAAGARVWHQPDRRQRRAVVLLVGQHVLALPMGEVGDLF
jgi:hypothetical protein